MGSNSGESTSSSGGDSSSTKSIRLIANNQWINHEFSPNQSSGSGGATALFAVGDKLHFTCTPGYELYGGPEFRTCTQYGQWSGSSTPRCRMIDCGRPAPIGQEGRYFLLNETTSFNSLVEYSCVRPFKLIEVRLRLAGNLIETLTTAQAGVTQILTALPIGVKVCANNGQWMPNDQQPKCVSPTGPQVDTSGQAAGSKPTISGSGGSGGNGQFDGADNTLDQRHHRIQVFTAGGGGGGTTTSIDGLSGDNSLSGMRGQSSAAIESAGQSSIWAKVVIAICLLIMMALIMLTLICIRSGKKPKHAQAHQRVSILQAAAATNGHQAAAAAAAAAMQLQLSGGKGLAPGVMGHAHHAGSHNGNHHHQHPHLPQSVASVGQPTIAASSLLSPSLAANGHQEHYINGMQQIFSGSMVGQSQMSTGHLHQQVHQMEANKSNVAGRSMVTITGGQGAGELALQAGKTGVLMGRLGSRAGDLDYSLRVEPDKQQVIATSGVDHNQLQLGGNKTIRHNPNGLVTFVSPAQQQQQLGRAGASSNSSSSGVSSTSQHHHHVSPQSISTSLSVHSNSGPSSTASSSSSSSPSNSNHSSTASSSAHHTSATRLSDSSSSGQANKINNINNQRMARQQQQQQPMTSEYQAPQPVYGLRPGSLAGPQTSPPSLPAHPPPQHRVEQHHKQLLKHRNGGKQSSPASSTNGARESPQSGAGHYMDPSGGSGGGAGQI